MKVLFLFLTFLVAFASVAVAQSDIKLEIGAILPQKYVSRKIKGQIFTHTSQFRPFIRKKIDDVTYIIAFDEKTREIRYIHTDDKDFRTENGLRVGSQITVTQEQLDIYPTWEIRAPATPDGWQPVVGTDFVLPSAGEGILSKLKVEKSATVKISSFSKGSN